MSLSPDPQGSATFASLRLADALCEACAQLGFTKPSDIQAQAIPYALQGRDIIGLAATGSGKTAAFALPILDALWTNPQPFFACVLAPTRELAYQISEQFTALGSTIGVRCATIVGGMSMVDQAIALAKRPHIVVATPGRLEDHLANTKGFSLRSIKYLVMDEADRLLDMDFGTTIDKLLEHIPVERHTYLFSATMTTKVAKLQRASLRNPVKLEVSTKYSTVDTLLQYYVFLPLKHKDAYLIHLVNELAGQTIIVFVRTVHDAQRIAIIMRLLGLSAVPLHGQMPQSARLGALNKFKSGSRSVLIATDVAARGLDIPAVDVVVNFDLPSESKAYVHRVGRTARAGRAGKAIAFVSQYDVELYGRLEHMLDRKLPEYPLDKSAIPLLLERVADAQREAARELREQPPPNANGPRPGKKDRAKRDARDSRDIGEDDSGRSMKKRRR